MSKRPAISSEIMPNDDEPPSRSLDAFLETAYNSTSIIKWQYWIIMLSLGVANSSDASEILCLSYILSDSSFQDAMLQDTAWRAGILAGSVFLGMLLGGLFIGTLGDWFGRKPMLLVGLLCNCIAGILSAVCQNAIQLSLVRMVAGVGIGATVPPLFTLVTELAPPSRRGFFVTVAASFWMVGSIYVALTALVFLAGMGASSWRLFAVACALPSALGAGLVATLVPESPRFLALQGKTEEGVNIANHLARQMNHTSAPPWTLPEALQQFPRQSGHQPPVPRASFGSSSSIIVDSMRAMREAWSDFSQSTSKLYSLQLKRTTLPLQMVWFTLSFGSYGILTWINTLFVAVHLENVYRNALLFAISNLPGNILSAMFMDRIGRAAMLVSSVLAAAMSLVVFAVFARDNGTASIHHTGGIVTSACCFQAFTIAAWNAIDCMTSELFPTTVRSTGTGVCAASGRIGALMAQFVNGALVGNPVRLLLVASFTLVLGAITPFLLPNADMTLQPLEDDLAKRNTTCSGDLINEEPIPFLPNDDYCKDDETPYESVGEKNNGSLDLS
jgi:VNT family MFS transporter (synaptic vesicle glycoprotein 2)